MIHIYVLFTILIVTIGLFISGLWRFDVVALMALLTAVVTGIVPFDKAFIGFANPAVITVVCVMIITQAITQSGILDYFIRRLTPINANPYVHIATLTVITAFLSAFMNNVGALALMMPLAIQTSIRSKRSPSFILMPLAFGSVLGGLITTIGTPPNLLISAFRGQLVGNPFSMFDFTPVGLVAAIVGIVFIVFVGWRLLPLRKAPKQMEDLFQIKDYITEVKVIEDSPVIGMTLRELETLTEGDLLVIGFIRRKRKRLVVPPDEIFQANDILIIEANHNDLERLINKGKLELVTGEASTSELLRSDKISLIEAVVPQGSSVEGRSSQGMRLRSRHNLNIIAISRAGNPFKKRLNRVNLRVGDVVLIQGETDNLQENISQLGFLPLMERGIQIGLPRKAFLPSLIFLIAIVLAATQILPVQIAFACAVVILVVLNIMPARKLYDAIDWPVIVLLGAMIPLGQALQSTGATGYISHFIGLLSQFTTPSMILALLFIITMTLSDLMNNAATAVVMAPIAASIANSLHVNIDPCLMTVAVAASCSFLTPISHQNNTLVMGPGGYRFSDYIRMGLPLEILIFFVAMPMILWMWPL